MAFGTVTFSEAGDCNVTETTLEDAAYTQIGFVVCKDKIYLKEIAVVDVEGWMTDISREKYKNLAETQKAYAVTATMSLSSNLAKQVATRVEHLEPARTELMSNTLRLFCDEFLTQAVQSDSN